MSDNGHYITQYDRRLNLVTEAIKTHTKLQKKDAANLAVHVLQAIDHIPEKIR